MARKWLIKLGAKHWVLEKDPTMLTPYEMPHFWPAEAAAEIVPQADVLVITGTTLVNDTLGDLIALARPSARIVVVGPTVTLVPDAFFGRRCDILGGREGHRSRRLHGHSGGRRLRLSFLRKIDSEGHAPKTSSPYRWEELGIEVEISHPPFELTSRPGRKRSQAS
jgi:hypothetical protein